MSLNFPVIAWAPVAFGGMQAVYNLDASLDNTFVFKLAGTDTNGDRVVPEFVIIDNLNNNSTAKIVYGPNIYSVAPYTRKKFPIAPNLDTVILGISLGTVAVGFYNYDPGIPDDLNQYANTSGSAFSSTTWDATRNTSGYIALDSANLIGTYSYGGPGPPFGGYLVGDVAKTSGKYYYEPKYILSNFSSMFGVAIQTISQPIVNGTFPGKNLDAIGIQGDGTIYLNNAGVGTGWTNGVPANGESVRIAFDLTAALFWVGKLGQNWNNTSGADPATGTGGISIASMTAGAKTAIWGSGAQFAMVSGANFGGSPFLNPIPAGFGPIK